MFLDSRSHSLTDVKLLISVAVTIIVVLIQHTNNSFSIIYLHLLAAATASAGILALLSCHRTNTLFVG